MRLHEAQELRRDLCEYIGSKPRGVRSLILAKGDKLNHIALGSPIPGLENCQQRRRYQKANEP